MNNQKNFSIGDIIKKSWDLTLEHLPLLVVITLLTFVVTASGRIFESQNRMNEMSSFLTGAVILIVTTIISTILRIGILRILLIITAGGKPHIPDLYRDYPLFFRYFFGSILVGILILIGFVLLIVPGVIVALGLSFYAILMIDQNTGIQESMRKSWDLTKGIRLKLLGLFVLLGLINILGALALGIGLLVTIPLSMLAPVVLYRQLTSGTTVLPLEPQVATN